MKKIYFFNSITVSLFFWAIALNSDQDLSFIHHVKTDESLLINGLLSEQSLPKFLASAFLTRQKDFPEFSLKSPSCLSANNIKSEGGFFTKQLFLVTSTCTGITKHYIIKEPVNGILESTRLNNLSNQPILKDLILPNEKKDYPSLALPIAYLSYSSNNISHYLLLMPQAKGKVLCNAINDLKSFKKDQDIAQMFRQLGLELANFHNLWPEINLQDQPLIKDSIIHGDLKCLNILYDDKTNHYTLIDNESIVSSLEQPSNRLIDIAKVLFGYNLKNDDARVLNVLNGVDLDKWYNVAVKNFFKGYVESFPKNQQKKALEDLRNLMNSNFPNSYNQYAIHNMLSTYINPIFDVLGKEF
jgi:serine/threonine protein kinase